VPSNGTVVKIFTRPENDLDGEFYVHVRYDMDNLKLRKLRPSYLSGIHKHPETKKTLKISLNFKVDG
jgi:hypothetical protein